MKIIAPEITITLTPYEFLLLKVLCRLGAKAGYKSAMENKLQGELANCIGSREQYYDLLTVCEAICSADCAPNPPEEKEEKFVLENTISKEEMEKLRELEKELIEKVEENRKKGTSNGQED